MNPTGTRTRRVGVDLDRKRQATRDWYARRKVAPVVAPRLPFGIHQAIRTYQPPVPGFLAYAMAMAPKA